MVTTKDRVCQEDADLRLLRKYATKEERKYLEVGKVVFTVFERVVKRAKLKGKLQSYLRDCL